MLLHRPFKHLLYITELAHFPVLKFTITSQFRCVLNIMVFCLTDLYTIKECGRQWIIDKSNISHKPRQYPT